MGYSKEIHRQAMRTLEQRRLHAQEQAQRRRDELFAALPKLQDIERSLAHTGLAAARAAISGAQAAELIERLRSENLSLQRQRAQLLAQAGFPEDVLTPHYTCPRCEDTGYLGQQQCSCLRELLRNLAYESLGSASDIQNCRFDNFRLDYYPAQPTGKYSIVPRRAMEKVLSVCREYARGFSLRSESLLLCGGTGLGKTHLSLAIAHEVIRAGFGVVYTTSPNLLDKLQNQQFSRTQTADEDWQALALDCDLLIIDDLGAEFSTSFTVAALYNLINSRMIGGRPTIISTNLDETVLRERYGDRVLSRLLCTYHPLQFYGEDIRMLKRLETHN